MSHYHCRERFYSKKKSGTTAIAKASYRSGEELYDEQQNRTYSYKKPEVLYSKIYLPDNAPREYENRQTLWNSVMAVEKRKDAQYAHETEFSLSKDLTKEQAIKVAEEYGALQASKGICCDLSIHWKEGNPHIHALETVRPINEDGTWGKKYSNNGKSKEHGRSTNNWYDKSTIKERRSKIAEIQNQYLSPEQHIDSRSYKEQGRDDKPKKNLVHSDWERTKEYKEHLDKGTNEKFKAKRTPFNKEAVLEHQIVILEDKKKELEERSKSMVEDISRDYKPEIIVSTKMETKESEPNYPFGCDLDKVKLKYVCVTNEQIDSGEDAMVRFESEYNLYSKICKANGNEHLRLSKDRYAKEKYGVDIHLFVEKTIGRNTDGEWLKYWENDGVTGYEKNARVLSYDELRDAMNAYNEKHGIQIENRIVENPLYHIEDDPTNWMLDKDSKSSIKYAKYQISKNFKEIQKHPDLMNKLKDCTIKYKQGISQAIEAVNAKLIDSIGSGGGAGGSGRDGESAEEFKRFMAPIVKAFLQLAMEIIEKLKEYKKQMVYVTDFKADPTPVKPELAKKSVEHTKPEMTPYEQLVKGSDKEVTKMSLEERVEWAKLQSALSSIKDEKVINDFNSRVAGHIKLDGSQMQDLIKLANDLKKLSVKDIKALDKVKVDDLVR